MERLFFYAAWFTKWETTGFDLKIKMAMGKFNTTTTTQGRNFLASRQRKQGSRIDH
jgi:hypothetical protein